MESFREECLTSGFLYNNQNAKSSLVVAVQDEPEKNASLSLLARTASMRPCFLERGHRSPRGHVSDSLMQPVMDHINVCKSSVSVEREQCGVVSQGCYNM